MSKTQYTAEQAEKLYKKMSLIRHFEASVKRDFLNGEIPGFCHLYIGEEAIATGVNRLIAGMVTVWQKVLTSRK